jgi:fucose permease
VKRLLVPLSGLAFISLGLPDGLVGVAWPSIRASFGRDLDALGGLLVAATVGYVSSSFASGRLLRHLNLGVVLAVSCLLTASALFGYAAASHWLAMIGFAVVLGLGGGAIDAALNTYIAIRHSPRMLNWLHACYGVGAAAGPAIMTAVLGMGLRWQRGYFIVAVAQLGLAGAFALTLRWWPTTSAASGTPHADGVADIRATLSLPAARLGILTFVAYSGVEASIGAWTYTLLTADRGTSPVDAGLIVSVFWGSLTAGRLLAAWAGERIPVATLLGGAMLSVLAGTLIVWIDLGTPATLAGVLIAGCACGPIFPTLVAVTPARLGPAHAANAVGFQIAAAALGLSVVPGFVGLVADAVGVRTIGALFVVLAALLGVAYRLLDRAAPLKRVPATVFCK